MKFKNLCALFLLSIASVYFICPVQCAAIREAGENTAANGALIHQRHLTSSHAVDENSQLTCCNDKDQPIPSHKNREEGEGHCCFDRWESLGASEPQVTSQIQKEILSSVVHVPATPRISSASISFTTKLRLSYIPSTDSPTAQLFPRAPPFSLS